MHNAQFITMTFLLSLMVAVVCVGRYHKSSSK